MKYACLNMIAMVLLSVFANAQEVSPGVPLKYTDVIYLKDSTVSQSILYSRAKSWMYQTFKDSKAVIEIDNPTNGELSGKGAVHFMSKNIIAQAGVAGVIRYLVSIYVKDGRYKYIVTDFIHDPIFYKSMIPISLGLITDSKRYPYEITKGRGVYLHKVWKELQEDSDTEAKLLIASLKKAMASESETEKSDW